MPCSASNEPFPFSFVYYYSKASLIPCIFSCNLITKIMKLSFVASFPPRECGIATFTRNLMGAIGVNLKSNQGKEDEVAVIAMNDPKMSYQYPPEVAYVIRQEYREDYTRAAYYIGES